MLDSSDIKMAQRIQNLGFDLQKVMGVYPLMFTPALPLSRSGISARNFAHWKKEGLVDLSVGEERTWVRLDLIQFIWLKLIKTMRDYGLPFKVISRVKEKLFQNQLDKLDKIKPKAFKKEMKEFGHDQQYSDNALELIRFAAKNGALLSKEYTLLTSAIGSALFGILSKNDDMLILISNPKLNAKVVLYPIFQENETNSIPLNSIGASALIISIRQHLIDSISQTEGEFFLNAYSLINTQESKALELIQQNDFSEIQIQLKNETSIQTWKAPVSKKEKEILHRKVMLNFVFNDYLELRIVKSKKVLLAIKNKLL